LDEFFEESWSYFFLLLDDDELNDSYMSYIIFLVGQRTKERKRKKKYKK
jgi:hypothetical protein